jgi:RNA polymerase sigma-70 factor, ECF subfamily
VGKGDIPLESAMRDVRRAMAQIDPATVAALRRGEDRAYAAVIDALQGPVYRFLLRLTRDAAAAEDLTQETFVAIWQGIESFRGKSQFTTWAFGVAYRQHLRWRDKRSVATVPLDEERDEAQLPGPSASVEEADEQRRVRQAVYSLPDPYRESVSLVYMEGLSYREAAEVLEVPVGTVKSRMHGALSILRNKLQGCEVDDNEMR